MKSALGEGLHFILLEYNCFTMLYYFLLFNEVNQLYVYIYPFPLGPPSQHPSPIPPIWVIREHQAEPLVLYSSFTLAIYFTHGSVCRSISPNSSHSLCPLLCPHVHSLCLCLYPCVLQTGSFVAKCLNT